MNSPFDNLFGHYYGNVIIDSAMPEDTVHLFNPRYKTVQVGEGEPPRFKEVIDWDATAKAEPAGSAPSAC